jgi:pimeloyl-ACP methyl ester carboxylesterase
MKFKSIVITLFTVAVIIIFIKALMPQIAFRMVTNYEPYTHEKVFSDPQMCADYGINNCKSPEDYGYGFKELNFYSLDSISLNGWFIQAKNASNKCIVLIHGRTSNRLKTMKYLALVDSLDLDTAYNVFIPDLRNSGKSEPSKTYMGYKFGEDVTATLMMLKDNFRQEAFILYGFSMGAMAVSNALGRPELNNHLAQNNIIIEKIILDSPLANVKETIRDQSSEIPLGGLFFENAFNLYSASIHDFGEQMRLSKLLPKSIPVLILQSRDDHLTLAKDLDTELHEMKDYQNLHIVYFEGPDHVRIFQDDQTRVKYLDVVEAFLSEN